MILDYENEMGPLERKYMYGTVLVDGREIDMVKYADTEAGIVRTLEIFPERGDRYPRELGGTGAVLHPC